MDEPEKYLFEEYKPISSLRSWLIIIGLCVLLVGSGLFVHLVVPDTPRTWDYGAMETIPGASVYSSMSPNPGKVGPAETRKVPGQIEPLPGAKPLEKLKPLGYERKGQ
jgi:hypothetical protein